MHFALPTSVIHFLLKSQSRKAHPEIQRFAKDLSSGFSESENMALAELLEMRHLLAANNEQISFEDFGSSLSNELDPKPVVKTRTIGDIYGRASIPKTWSEFLFSLVRFLQPKKVLEIGTNIGVGAAYLQKALDLNGVGELYSLEGAERLSEFAAGQISSYCEGSANLITGPFSRSLPALLGQVNSFDLVFIDGHHRQEAAIEYFDLIRPKLARPSMVIFDDIEPWSPVNKAWNTLVKSENIEKRKFDSIYLFKKGLIYFH